MGFYDRATLTITTTGATSETQATVSMNGELVALLLSQTAGSTFPSTSKVSVAGSVNGQVFLSSGQVLTALAGTLYPQAAFNGSTGGALAAYRSIPLVNECLNVTVIHGTTAGSNVLGVVAITDGNVTKTA